MNSVRIRALIFFWGVSLGLSLAFSREAAAIDSYYYKRPAAKRSFLYGELGGAGGLESMVSETGSIPKRNLSVWQIHGIVGVNLWRLIVGGTGEWAYHYQWSGTQVSNASGTSYGLGPAVGIHLFPRIIVSGSMILLGNYNLSRLTEDGDLQHYLNASGYRGQVSAVIYGKASIDLSYQQTKYSKTQVGSVSYDFKSDRAVFRSVQIGLSLHY